MKNGKNGALNLKVSLPISFLKEDKYFIAYSPVLDLSTSGKTFEEAKKRFDEVVEIFFEELLEKNTLDKVLKELGWQKVQNNWSPPVLISQETENFNISLIN